MGTRLEAKNRQDKMGADRGNPGGRGSGQAQSFKRGVTGC